MAVAEKLHELKQKLSKAEDEIRELCERVVKEDRAFTKDEDARYITLCGSTEDKSNGGELIQLRTRIHQLERMNANDRIGHDARSGTDPFKDGNQVSDPLDVPLPHEDPRNNRNGAHKFRILRAAQGFCPGGQGLTGIEKEVSQEIEGRTGIPSSWGGFKMPLYTRSLSFAEIDERRRALDRVHSDRRDSRALDSGAGAGSIPTVLEADWIELLRNAMRVKQAGMREIMDIRGKLAIPRQNNAATAYWVAESAAPTGSNQTLDQILFTPHTIGAYTDISRRFFELTILDSGETFVKEDLTAILGRGADLAALNGPGNNFTPLGIFQNTGITSTRTVALGTNGGVPTWAALVEMQTIINRGNAADLGPGTYIGNADVEGTLATTLKIGSTFPIYLLDDEGRVYRKPLLTTQQIPANFTKGTSGATLSAMVYGVFNQLIAGYWSGIDILVDPYTGSNTGTIRIVSLMDMDIQVRHNEAFSVIVDMITDQSL